MIIRNFYQALPGAPGPNSSALAKGFITFAFMSLRAFTRRPVGTLVVITTLGLGLGAMGVTAALFSAVLWPRVPYRDPQQLVRSEERRVGKECRSRWSAD